MRSLFTAFLLGLISLTSFRLCADEPWPRHTIDDSSQGADGVRLADLNGDGLLDIATGWEEGGIARVYQHPGLKQAREKWPAVTVGEVATPEDAVLADLDGDGQLDVISSCEGKTRTMFVHWAPSDSANRFRSDAWRTEAFPAAQKQAQWMFCLPAQFDGRHGIDLIIGAKGPQAQISWLQAPEDPRRLDDWKLHKLCDAGWIMSLIRTDIDGDGDPDILASDRRGDEQGCVWLENPGSATAAWTKHPIGAGDGEVMFLDYGDVDGDSLNDVVVPITPRVIHWHRRLPGDEVAWETIEVPYPEGMGTAKSTAVTDINGDGLADISLSCENAKNKQGVAWLEQRRSGAGEITWSPHDISGPTGTKFDLLQVYDVDGDGDPDLLTCEERENLGVIWYENPLQ